MEYKAVIMSYSVERTKTEPANYRPLKQLEDLLNNKVSPVSDRAELKGFTVKEIHATPMGEKIIYTVVFQKE